MALVRTTSLTLYGLNVSGIALSAGENQLFDVFAQDPATRLAFSITSSSQTLSIWQLDINGNQVSPPLLTVPGAPQSDATGHVQFSFSLSSVGGGTFGLTIANNDSSGDVFYLCPLSIITIAGQPLITILPTAPNSTAASTAGTFPTSQTVRRVISASDGTDFRVTLPTFMADGNYSVTGSIENSSITTSYKFPNAAGDRTNASFRLQLDFALNAGDTMIFQVVHF